MSEQHDARRSCPTRADGAEVLIAHTITPSACQERQGRLYHKCFTCVHLGAGATTPLAPLHRLPLLHEGEPGRRRAVAAG